MTAMTPHLIQLAYLAATILFILGLHNLRTPVTAPRGNRLAALGMLLAVIATLLHHTVVRYELLLIGLIVGGAIGTLAARLVQMTAMPQMVGLFNGFGGGASACVALGEYWRLRQLAALPAFDTMLTIILGTLIGGATLTGSLVAFGKLQGIVAGSPRRLPLQHACHTMVGLASLAAGVVLVAWPHNSGIFLLLLGLALLLGVLLVRPIGAADMPVVISLLNACSGLAASAAGFVLQNNLLIIAGALVGASGVILTQIMCRAMNRSLGHLLFEEFGSETTGAGATATAEAKPVHTIDVEEAAMMLAYAHSVIIVPGYGMAVAQAQHVVHDLAEQLRSRGVQVTYAIHPVAGRMPGHMNVLLAEANVPYDALADMETINPAFEHTDVALVIGANDIVNPAARVDTHSPIYGMPILDVDKAQHAIVIKRSLSPGFAGIDNALFYEKRTMMLFGDARQVVGSLIHEVQQL
jgi:NAD(P) transhydrogenase subunit beta